MTPTTTVIEYSSYTATVFRASVGQVPSVLVTLHKGRHAPVEVFIHTIDGFAFYGSAMTFDAARQALRDEGAHGVIHEMAAAAELVVPGILDPYAAEEVRQFLAFAAS